jgi:cytochrome c oxidase cbb3-type subunit I/II
MIRTLSPDVVRYGEYSRLGESIYDRPFQWGSKRTGPDLAREGLVRPNVWHLQHFREPRSLSEGSNMPAYPWLLENDLKTSDLLAKINALRTLGDPYPEYTDETIQASVRQESLEIARDLRDAGELIEPEKEVIALIAYIQRLGTPASYIEKDALEATAAVGER